LPSVSTVVVATTVSPTITVTSLPGNPVPITFTVSPCAIWLGEATQTGRTGVFVGDGVAVGVNVGVLVEVAVCVDVGDGVVVDVGIDVGVAVAV
jgi:hypothetical protein